MADDVADESDIIEDIEVDMESAAAVLVAIMEVLIV